MKIFTSIEDIRSELNRAKMAGLSIGFVPTMGALHEGHLTLMRKAKSENDVVVASVFVNPTQFNVASDLEKYPRNLEADCVLMRGIGVDLVFAPSVEEMYPEVMATIVDVPSLTSGLIGKIRPGHFQGMASVVVKLFNIIGATNAYFGEKDFQQLAIIRRFSADLNIPTKVHGVPIVREADGLAMSSRNQRLTPEDRRAAPIIYRSILAVIASYRQGENDVVKLRSLVADVLSQEPRAELLSVDFVDKKTLVELKTVIRDAVILMNVRFGEIILIDQAHLTQNEEETT